MVGEVFSSSPGSQLPAKAYSSVAGPRNSSMTRPPTHLFLLLSSQYFKAPILWVNKDKGSGPREFSTLVEDTSTANISQQQSTKKIRLQAGPRLKGSDQGTSSTPWGGTAASTLRPPCWCPAQPQALSKKPSQNHMLYLN